MVLLKPSHHGNQLGLPNEVIKTSDNSLAPASIFAGEKMYVEFSGDCLKQGKATPNKQIHCL